MPRWGKAREVEGRLHRALPRTSHSDPEFGTATVPGEVQGWATQRRHPINATGRTERRATVWWGPYDGCGSQRSSLEPEVSKQPRWTRAGGTTRAQRTGKKETLKGGTCAGPH